MRRRGLTGRRLLGSLALATCLEASIVSAAGTERIALDSTRSHAEFSVKVMWLISVHGRFGKVHGAVDVDRFRNMAVVDAHLDADAVEMSSRSYEDWVKSAEFFDVAHYPDIHFLSESFPLQRLRRGGLLSGTLTIRGVEQPVTFEFEPADCDHPAYDCPILVHGAIHRSAFGMRSRRGALGDKVELHFEVYAIPAAERLDP